VALLYILFDNDYEIENVAAAQVFTKNSGGAEAGILLPVPHDASRKLLFGLACTFLLVANPQEAS